MVAAQRVQFSRQAGQPRMVVFKTVFDKVNVFGNVTLAREFERQEGFDDVLGYRRTH